MVLDTGHRDVCVYGIVRITPQVMVVDIGHRDVCVYGIVRITPRVMVVDIGQRCLCLWYCKEYMSHASKHRT
jgi:hypothetical protein